MTNIVKVEHEDIKECAQFYLEVFNKAPWNDHWTVETAYKRLKDIYMSPNFLGFKYIEEGEIKGAVFGNCEQWYEGRHFNLKEIFISDELQGKGVGSKILKILEDTLKDLGVSTIILFTSRDETYKFYVKNGFNEMNFLCMMDKKI